MEMTRKFILVTLKELLELLEHSKVSREVPNVCPTSMSGLLEVPDWMEPRRHNEGSSKKKGLARRAKNHSLSNSLNNLHMEERSDEKDGKCVCWHLVQATKKISNI